MSAVRVQGSAAFERRLYGAMGVLALLVVLVGFARSFYLRSLFGAAPLADLLQLHGAVMTLWFALFLIQVSLVGARRVEWHRRLGVMAAVVATLLVPLGLATAVAFVRRVQPDAEQAAEAAGIATYDAIVLALFMGLVAIALRSRRRPDVHKRLMTLATLSLLGPPLGRLMPDLVAALVGQGLVLLPIVVDTCRNRRLHPAFGWGGALVLVSSGVAVALAESPAWRAVVLPWLS